MNVDLNQQRLMEQDMLDRDRQASSLAAAGMVAEHVSLSPMIGPSAAPSMQYLDLGMLDGNNDSNGIGNADNGPCLDDMETDFAKLFDPQNELKYMESDFDNLILPVPDDMSLIPGLEGHTSNC